MKVVYFFADNPAEYNCSNWRCGIPAAALNRTNGKHEAKLLYLGQFANRDPEAWTACEWADVIVIERQFIMGVNTSADYWHVERKKPVIATFDDAYNLLDENNPAFNFWRRGMLSPTERCWPIPLCQFAMVLGSINGGTVPSKVLAADWQPFTEMRVVPNYLNIQNYQNIPPVEHDGIVIGWGGSLSHMQSFEDSGVLSALKQVIEKRPKVKLLIAGDKRVYDRIDIPISRKMFQGFVPFPEWPKVLSQMDIGLAPLSGEYDKRRSWIKPLEYQMMRIPWLASADTAYQDLKDYGTLVKNGVGFWTRALVDAIDNLKGYKIKAAHLPYQFACEQGIDQNIEKVVATYEELANDNN